MILGDRHAVRDYCSGRDVRRAALASCFILGFSCLLLGPRGLAVDFFCPLRAHWCVVMPLVQQRLPCVCSRDACEQCDAAASAAMLITHHAMDQEAPNASPLRACSPVRLSNAIAANLCVSCTRKSCSAGWRPCAGCDRSRQLAERLQSFVAPSRERQNTKQLAA